MSIPQVDRPPKHLLRELPVRQNELNHEVTPGTNREGKTGVALSLEVSEKSRAVNTNPTPFGQIKKHRQAARRRVNHHVQILGSPRSPVPGEREAPGEDVRDPQGGQHRVGVHERIPDEPPRIRSPFHDSTPPSDQCRSRPARWPPFGSCNSARTALRSRRRKARAHPPPGRRRTSGSSRASRRKTYPKHTPRWGTCQGGEGSGDYPFSLSSLMSPSAIQRAIFFSSASGSFGRSSAFKPQVRAWSRLNSSAFSTIFSRSPGPSPMIQRS